ncbi:spore-associated protein A [Streptosporangium pseudovulgare]|uniref:Spore-associated protein A n=2 Tax=Streptosporangium pseudovulgare TaxID=35765 RepID=A0ABQ2QNZ1_9ACTN|nr:spore-associated protein A [Streptosporangium pseudovulgare]
MVVLSERTGMNIRTKLAALAGAAMVSTCLVASATPASAAGPCGGGYYQIDVYNISNLAGKTVGRTHLYYSRSTKKNCALTYATPAKRGYKAVKLRRSGTLKWTVDAGTFSEYAGPVYVSAPGKCIDIEGYIGGNGATYYSRHCG